MRSTLKLLCVLAHPDDESLGLGGMLARYASEGIETYLVAQKLTNRCHIPTTVNRVQRMITSSRMVGWSAWLNSVHSSE